MGRMSQQQFENFTASSLYCEKCKTAMPVRERLLLILPDKEIYDYLCTGCASSVGQREVTAGEKLMAQRTAPRRPRRRAPGATDPALARDAHRLHRDGRNRRAGSAFAPEFAASTSLSGSSRSRTNRPAASNGSKRRRSKRRWQAARFRSSNRHASKARRRSRRFVRLAPDVIVVMAYGQILPRSVLEIPRVACLNLHASLLPRHRGAAPIQAAILAGDRESGITVMYMDEGLDTGDVLLQSRLELATDETGGSLHDRLAQIAPAALDEALAHLQKGIAPRIPQDSSVATYAPKLEREDGRIDWTEAGRADRAKDSRLRSLARRVYALARCGRP